MVSNDKLDGVEHNKEWPGYILSDFSVPPNHMKLELLNAPRTNKIFVSFLQLKNTLWLLNNMMLIKRKLENLSADWCRLRLYLLYNLQTNMQVWGESITTPCEIIWKIHEEIKFEQLITCSIHQISFTKIFLLVIKHGKQTFLRI